MSKYIGDHIKEKVPNAYSIKGWLFIGLASLAIWASLLGNQDALGLQAPQILNILFYVGIFFCASPLIVGVAELLLSRKIGVLIYVIKPLMFVFGFIIRSLEYIKNSIIRYLIKDVIIQILKEKDINELPRDFTFKNKKSYPNYGALDDHYYDIPLNFHEFSYEAEVVPTSSILHWRCGIRFSKNTTFPPQPLFPRHKEDYPLYHLEKNPNHKELRVSYYSEKSTPTVPDNQYAATKISDYQEQPVILKIYKSDNNIFVDVLEINRSSILNAPQKIGEFGYGQLFAWADDINPFEINTTIKLSSSIVGNKGGKSWSSKYQFVFGVLFLIGVTVWGIYLYKDNSKTTSNSQEHPHIKDTAKTRTTIPLNETLPNKVIKANELKEGDIGFVYLGDLTLKDSTTLKTSFVMLCNGDNLALSINKLKPETCLRIAMNTFFSGDEYQGYNSFEEGKIIPRNSEVQILGDIKYKTKINALSRCYVKVEIVTLHDEKVNS